MKSLTTDSYNIKTNIFWSLITILSLIAAAFSVFENFSYSFKDFAIFGVTAAMVILPFVVFGHLAYRFHQKTLAQKTKEILETSRIHLATVEALATAIDARDQIGRGHITRTQYMLLVSGKFLISQMLN
ncbi:MAG: hypothetical protein ACR2MD_11090 [Aridibacter sp.]